MERPFHSHETRHFMAVQETPFSLTEDIADDGSHPFYRYGGDYIPQGFIFVSAKLQYMNGLKL